LPSIVFSVFRIIEFGDCRKQGSSVAFPQASGALTAKRERGQDRLGFKEREMLKGSYFAQSLKNGVHREFLTC